MEYKLAHKFLYDKAIEKGYIQLANHIKKVGPLKIKVSKMDFVSHLSKIIIGQQLSVQSAAAIWKRTDKILKENKYKKENIKLNQKFRDAGLSRQKIQSSISEKHLFCSPSPYIIGFLFCNIKFAIIETTFL